MRHDWIYIYNIANIQQQHKHTDIYTHTERQAGNSLRSISRADVNETTGRQTHKQTTDANVAKVLDIYETTVAATTAPLYCTTDRLLHKTAASLPV